MSQIKALILAGGFGTRLRPLSCSIPKILFPIAGRPMINWILDSISKSGINDAVLATNYLADMIKDHLGRRFNSVRLHYSLEDVPLGTGGPIKKAERLLKNGNFFVFNSDIISSPPLKQMLQNHISTGAIATIMLRKVKDPTHFGVAQINRYPMITSFIEKPKLKDAPSRWINAGIYVLNSKIFDYLESGKKLSIEKEIFPRLASAEKLFGYKYSGEWFDIGRFDEYMRANNFILNKISRFKPLIDPKVKMGTDSKLIPPLKVGSKSTLGEYVTLGPTASIGEAVRIGERSKVLDSILFSKVHVGKNSIIIGSIIGEAAVIGDNVRIGDGCVIGDHVQIHNKVILKNGVKICPYKEVNRSINRSGIVT